VRITNSIIWRSCWQYSIVTSPLCHTNFIIHMSRTVIPTEDGLSCDITVDAPISKSPTVPSKYHELYHPNITNCKNLLQTGSDAI